MRALLFVFGLVMLVFPQAGRAQQNSVLLELFTSQGCSSCPPADALLPQFDEIPGVVALALHVDYWDYLGWKDSFGSPKNTARQRAYSKEMRRRSIYTPQMVVQGTHDLVGHKAHKIEEGIRMYLSRPPLVVLNASRGSGGLEISVEPQGRAEGPFDIHVVRYLPAHDVTIEAGENEGRTISYTNIVTEWATVARWNGLQPGEFRVEGFGTGPLAVIVQAAGIGPVMAATKLP